MLKKTIFALASVCALMTQGNAFAQQTAEQQYQAIVGTSGQTTSFKETQHPSSLQEARFNTPYVIKKIEYEAIDTAPEKLKFFLPPGTVAFDANLYFFLANQQGKGVLKLNHAPTTALASVSPSNVFTTENLGGPTGRAYDETVLRNLLTGKEVRFYSEGGSSGANFMVLSSPENLIQPSNSGGYVYGNFQYPGGRLQRSLWAVYVDANCYEKWFSSRTTKWDRLGNPDPTATHTCDGSVGGGGSDGGGQVTTATIAGKTESTDANGNLVLNFTLKRPASETENTNRTSFWIAAYVPAGFLPQDAWFFFTPSGWQQLASTNPYTVAYQNSQAAMPEKTFTIATGLPVADMRHFNAQLHFGYMGSDGGFKDMGMIWSGN